MKINTLRGFTLIEVLVVITIIGILSTVVFANFSGARDDARNKALAVEMKDLQLAIELYKAQKGKYPPANPACDTDIGGDITISDSSACGSSLVIDELVPDFIVGLPDIDDSGNDNCNLFYNVGTSDAGWYKLIAENCFAGAATSSEGVQDGDQLARCPSTCDDSGVCTRTDTDFYESYAIYSKGPDLCI